jgi:hypothetical protein
MPRWTAPAALAVSLMSCLMSWPATGRAAEDEIQQPPASGASSAAAGAFLPWTLTPRTDTQRVLVGATGGYDGARASAAFEAAVEARVIGPLSLRAGGFYSSTSGTLRPVIGGSVRLLRQERHGFDAALAVSYRAEGFNLVPAVESALLLGRRFGDTSVILNVVDGIGTEDGEHNGSVRLAVLRPMTERLVLGLDARGRFDLERNFPEPTGEPSFDVVAGPVATYALGGYALSAYVGGTTVRYRAVEDRPRTGVATGLGVGRVF